MAPAENRTDGHVSARLPAGVLIFDSKCGVTDSDPAWTDATGLSREQTIGDGWLDALAPASRGPALAQLERAAGGSVSPASEWEVAPGGRARRIDAVAQRMPSAPESEHGCVVAIVDVTPVCAREDQLIHDATHDGLSGLLNRRAFDGIVEHALTRLARHCATLAVLFIDLDGFKSVNDRFGHGVGDAVLSLESDRLTSILRPSDTVARIGGDEFVILCEDVQCPSDAVSVATRVIEVSMRPFNVDGEAIQLGASVGIAFTGDAATTTTALVQRADRAMYAAKTLGRGQIAVCDEVVPRHSGAAVSITSRPGHRGALDIPVTTRVEVRERFLGRWSRGFDVETATTSGYRLRRTSDNHVLPGEFTPDLVRRAP
jgi:diguanylate cyclase (GGDEF)-like protein